MDDCTIFGFWIWCLFIFYDIHIFAYDLHPRIQIISIHFLLFWLWRQKGCGMVMFWWLPYFTLYCHCNADLMKIFIKMIFLLGYYIHCLVWCYWYHGDKLDILFLLTLLWTGGGHIVPPLAFYALEPLILIWEVPDFGTIHIL